MGLDPVVEEGGGTHESIFFWEMGMGLDPVNEDPVVGMGLDPVNEEGGGTQKSIFFGVMGMGLDPVIGEEEGTHESVFFWVMGMGLVPVKIDPVIGEEEGEGSHGSIFFGMAMGTEPTPFCCVETPSVVGVPDEASPLNIELNGDVVFVIIDVQEIGVVMEVTVGVIFLGKEDESLSSEL